LDRIADPTPLRHAHPFQLAAAEEGDYIAIVSLWRGPGIWEAVAAELGTYRRRGLGQLLTEDTVRFATARALVDAGVDPAELRVEWPHPVLKGSRVDLVAGGQQPAVLIEFKFPPEPVRLIGSSDTATRRVTQ
jgi:hypothetical protein